MVSHFHKDLNFKLQFYLSVIKNEVICFYFQGLWRGFELSLISY